MRIWVGDTDGTVYRLDVAERRPSPPRRIPTSSAVATLAVVDGGIWFAAQASAQSHRGGTLRIVERKPSDGQLRYDTDPLGSPFYNVSSLTGTGSSDTGARAAPPDRPCCPTSRPRLP